MEDDFTEAHLIKIHEEKYEEYLDFIKAERKKGGGVSKKTQAHLYWLLKNSNVTKALKETMMHYSSGRKVSVFDEIGGFIDTHLTQDEENYTMIWFCKEEIESYAKSYRLLSPKSKYFPTSLLLIKVFEYKPDKI